MELDKVLQLLLEWSIQIHAISKLSKRNINKKLCQVAMVVHSTINPQMPQKQLFYSKF